MLFGFGSNNFGQLGIGQQQEDQFATPQQIKIVTPTPINNSIGHSSDAYPSSLACGHSFSMAVIDGKVFAWGKNDKGQCGTGSLASSQIIWTPSSVHLKESTFITHISCGLEHSLAVSGLPTCFASASIVSHFNIRNWASVRMGELRIWTIRDCKRAVCKC